MKKTLIGLVCGLVGSLSVYAEELIFATEPTFPPFEFQDSKTLEFTGFEIDLINAMAKHMDVKVKLNPMGFDAIIPAILSNSVDVGVSGFTITEQRKKRVAFTNPYYNSSLSILVVKGTEGITKFDDLKNKVICAQIGTSGSLRAKKISGATVKNFNTQVDAILELRNRGCVAVVGDKPVTDYFLAKSKSKDFTHILVNEDIEQYGLVVNKNNRKLLGRLNEALKKVHETGEYKTIYNKWFGSGV